MFKKSLCLLLTGLMLLSVICGCNSEQNPGESSGISLETNGTAATEATEATEPEPTNGEKPPSKPKPFDPPDDTPVFINDVYATCEYHDYTVYKASASRSYGFTLVCKKKLPDDAELLIPDFNCEYRSSIFLRSDTQSLYLSQPEYIYMAAGKEGLDQLAALIQNRNRLYKLVFGEDGQQEGEYAEVYDPEDPICKELDAAIKAYDDFLSQFEDGCKEYLYNPPSLNYYVYEVKIYFGKDAFPSDPIYAFELSAGDMSRSIPIQCLRLEVGSSKAPVGYQLGGEELPPNSESDQGPITIPWLYFSSSDEATVRPWGTGTSIEEVTFKATENIYLSGFSLIGTAKSRVSIDHIEMVIVKNGKFISMLWEPGTGDVLIRKGETVHMRIYYTDSHTNQLNYAGAHQANITYKCKDEVQTMPVSLGGIRFASYYYNNLVRLVHLLHVEKLSLKEVYTNLKDFRVLV